MAVVADNAKNGGSEVALSIRQMGNRLGQIFYPLAYGYVAFWWGLQFTFIIGGGIMFIAALFLFFREFRVLRRDS